MVGDMKIIRKMNIRGRLEEKWYGECHAERTPLDSITKEETWTPLLGLARELVPAVECDQHVRM